MMPEGRQRLFLLLLLGLTIAASLPVSAQSPDYYEGVWGRAFSPLKGLIKMMFGPWEAYTVKFALFILLFALFYGIIRGLPQFQQTTQGVRVTIPLILAAISAAFMPNDLALGMGHAWGGFWGFAALMALPIIAIIIGVRNTAAGSPGRNFFYGLAMVLGGVSLMLSYRFFSYMGQALDSWLGLPFGRVVADTNLITGLQTAAAPATAAAIPTSMFADILFAIGSLLLVAGIIVIGFALSGIIRGGGAGFGGAGPGGGITFGGGGGGAGGGGGMPPPSTPPGVTPPGGPPGGAPPGTINTGQPARIRGVVRDSVAPNAPIQGQYVWIWVQRDMPVRRWGRTRIVPTLFGPYHRITDDEGKYAFDFNANFLAGDTYWIRVDHGAAPPAATARYNPETQTGQLRHDWNEENLLLARPGGGNPHQITHNLWPQTRAANAQFRMYVHQVGSELQAQVANTRARPPRRANLDPIRARIQEAFQQYNIVYQGYYAIFNDPNWGLISAADQTDIRNELALFAMQYQQLLNYINGARRLLRPRPPFP